MRGFNGLWILGRLIVLLGVLPVLAHVRTARAQTDPAQAGARLEWFPGMPTVSGDSVILVWPPAPDLRAVRYRILRRTGEGPLELRGEGSRRGPSFYFHDRIDDVDGLLSYAIEAFSANGKVRRQSEERRVDARRPPAPQRLLLRMGAEGVDLEWEPVPGASGYVIYRGPGEGDFDLAGTSWSFQFNDTPPRPGNYRYAVSALSACGRESARSGAVATPRAWDPGGPLPEIKDPAGSSGP